MSTTFRPMLCQAGGNELVQLVSDDGWGLAQKCLAPLTPILTDTGWSAIRYINAGTRVVGSDGQYHQVLASLRRPGRRDMVRINPSSAMPMTVTSDHRVLTSEGWLAAGQLTTSHWLVVPRPYLDGGGLDASFELDAGHGYRKTITWSADFAWFCGLWVANGSADKRSAGKTSGRVSIAFNTLRRDEQERAAGVFATLGVDPRIHDNRGGATQIYGTDWPLAQWLSAHFRHHRRDGHADDPGPRGKSLPAWLDSMSDEMATHFVSGWLAGDGHTNARGNTSGSTVSPHLAGLLYRQMLGRGWKWSIRDEPTSWTYKGERRHGRTYSLGQLRSDRNMRIDGGIYLLRVRDVAPASPTQSTYDLTVADTHDFWASSIVHNCDGVRLVVSVSTNAISAFNRRGASATIPLPVTYPLLDLMEANTTVVLDGELMGGVFHVFDLPRLDGQVAPGDPLSHRRLVLEHLFALWSPADAVQLLPMATTTEAKAELVRAAIASGAEGVVAKALDSAYQPGKRHPAWRKFKFTHEVDCVVTEVGRDGKASLVVSVYDGNQLVEIGECTALAGDGPAVRVGDVVVISYLLWSGKRLVQPTLPKIRHDKAAADCTVSQLSTSGSKIVLPTTYAEGTT